MLQRYFFELSFNGTDFFGWQRQPNHISVQEVIESALTKMHSNSVVKILGCGRTDTGVHAKHFILHTDLPEIKVISTMIFKLNKMLPDSIVITDIFAVDSDHHARFSAKSRTYRYFIHSNKNPFKVKLSWRLSKELDLVEMNKAAKFLLGTQDFTSLSKLHTDVKTNICTVSKAEWVENEEGIYFEITADRFLRNMVRATVGTLLEVGLGKTTADQIPVILKAMDRQAASTSVPAHGLFLWEVKY